MYLNLTMWCATAQAKMNAASNYNWSLGVLPDFSKAISLLLSSGGAQQPHIAEIAGNDRP